MRYLLALLLLTIPLSLMADEGIEQDIPGWAVLVTSAVTALVAWAFKLWRARMKVDTEQHQLDATKSLMEQRNFIIDQRIMPFLESTAIHYITIRLPVIIKQAADGKFDWSEHFNHAQKYLKQRVLEKFTSENVDVLKVIGEKELSNLIDRVLVRLISNLPISIQAMLPSSVTANLSKYASNFVVSQAERLLPNEG